MWLSLVEHYVRDVGVVGSNPAIPTNLKTTLYGWFFNWYGAGLEATRQWVHPQEKGGRRTPVL